MDFPIRVETCADIDQALERVSRAGLCDDDETRSQVQLLLTHDRAMVRQVWLVTDPATGKDVGMAMLSDPTGSSQGLPVLNLFVDLDHREHGVGRALVEAVLKEHDAHAVAAYYTTNAVRLYRHAGFPPAEIHFTPEISALWDAGRVHEAGQRFIEHVLKEREEFDRLEAEYRARPRPGFR